MKKIFILLFLFAFTPSFSPVQGIHPIKEQTENTLQEQPLSRKEKRALRKQKRKEKRAQKLINKLQVNGKSKDISLLTLGLVLLGVALLLGLISLLVSIWGALGLIAKLFALGGIVLVILGLLRH